MRYAVFFALSLYLGALSLEAQLPIRNYINLHRDTIFVQLDAEALEYNIYSITPNGVAEFEEEYYYDEKGEEAPVKEQELAIQPIEEMAAGAPLESTISIFSSPEFGYTGNEANLSLRQDTCYLVQYNWFGDQFVLASIRNVLNTRSDFTPCFDMKDCWTQQKAGEDTLYYWNLFDRYEGDDTWKALRIEAEREFEENRWGYQFMEGKY